jgi:hypothetical protein
MRKRPKRRSGWKHPHDPARNRRRCRKRRRSQSVARRLLRAMALELELANELEEFGRQAGLRC